MLNVMQFHVMLCLLGDLKWFDILFLMWHESDVLIWSCVMGYDAFKDFLSRSLCMIPLVQIGISGIHDLQTAWNSGNSTSWGKKTQNGDKLNIFAEYSHRKEKISLSHAHIQYNVSSLTALVSRAAEAFDQILFLDIVCGKQWGGTLHFLTAKNCNENKGGHWNSHHGNSDHNRF